MVAKVAGCLSFPLLAHALGSKVAGVLSFPLPAQALIGILMTLSTLEYQQTQVPLLEITFDITNRRMLYSHPIVYQSFLG